MEISIGSLIDGARQASGAVAIIDVFRAFTTAAVALANGASMPDVSPKSVWFAVLGLRELALAEPAFARAAARAIKKIAVAHPHDWQEAFIDAGENWNGAEKNRLRDDIELDVVRAALRPLGPV